MSAASSYERTLTFPDRTVGVVNIRVEGAPDWDRSVSLQAIGEVVVPERHEAMFMVTDATAGDLSALKGLDPDSLDAFDFGWYPLGDQDIGALLHLSSIQELFVSRSLITNRSMAQICRLTHLRKLDLSKTRITGAGLKCIGSLGRLCELNMEGTSVADEGLSYLGDLPRLRVLNLDASGVTSQGLIGSRLPVSLEALSLNKNQSIDDKGLTALVPLTSLRVLLAGFTAIRLRNEVVRNSIQNLHQVGLVGCDIEDDGMRMFTGVSDLRWLWLSMTRITDSGLVHLLGLEELAELRLSGTKVTVKGVLSLAGLKNLRVIWIDDTRVTRKQLPQVRSAFGERVVIS